MIHVRQPAGSRCCGQACVAMVLDKTLAEVCAVIGCGATGYPKLRKAAAAFGREFGPTIIMRHTIYAAPTFGVFIGRVIWSRKLHASHFIVLNHGKVFDPLYDDAYPYYEWLDAHRCFWPDVTLTSWAQLV